MPSETANGRFRSCQLEESPAFRTNIGLLEVTGNPVTVELLAYTPTRKVAGKLTIPLGAGEYLPRNGIFQIVRIQQPSQRPHHARVISGTGRSSRIRIGDATIGQRIRRYVPSPKRCEAGRVLLRPARSTNVKEKCAAALCYCWPSNRTHTGPNE